MQSGCVFKINWMNCMVCANTLFGYYLQLGPGYKEPHSVLLKDVEKWMERCYKLYANANSEDWYTQICKSCIIVSSIICLLFSLSFFPSSTFFSIIIPIFHILLFSFCFIEYFFYICHSNISFFYFNHHLNVIFRTFLKHCIVAKSLSIPYRTCCHLAYMVPGINFWSTKFCFWYWKSMNSSTRLNSTTIKTNPFLQTCSKVQHYCITRSSLTAPAHNYYAIVIDIPPISRENRPSANPAAW